MVQREHGSNAFRAMLSLHWYKKPAGITGQSIFGSCFKLKSTSILASKLLAGDPTDILCELLTRVGLAELTHFSLMVVAVSVVAAAYMSRHDQSLPGLADGDLESKKQGTSISVVCYR
jgi:hypothetical protein